MKAMHHLMAVRRRALLAFVLAALGMSALVPAGVMIAPQGEAAASIILCPETHPLARALGARAAPDMAALHAAMGHTVTQGPQTSLDEPAGGHHQPHHDHAVIDHAAMGHAAAPAADPAADPPSPGTAAPAQSCAFAGLALAALLPERSEAPPPFLAPLPEPLAFPSRLQLVAPAHLRPPLRAPPALI